MTTGTGGYQDAAAQIIPRLAAVHLIADAIMTELATADQQATQMSGTGYAVGGQTSCASAQCGHVQESLGRTT